MSMHLEGPWLTTTGKKKGKKKFASAEHKRKAEEAEANWKALQKKWATEADEKKRKRGLEAPALNPLAVKPFRRETTHYNSLNSSDSCGVATKAAPKVYTGTLVKGIATMHKSNAVPVFNDQDAIDISKMRR